MTNIKFNNINSRPATSINNPTAKIGISCDIASRFVYCLFELCEEESISTPKYIITHMYGDYAPFNVALTNRQKNMVVYLKPLKSSKQNAPELQLTYNNYNITGLKFLTGWNIPNGRFAYGNPNPKAEIKRNGKIIPNPFYNYQSDGYIIQLAECSVQSQMLGLIPKSFELIVVREGKQMISQTCRTLANGGLNPDLDWLRNHASKKPILLI